jgi:hypothetical protein
VLPGRDTRGEKQPEQAIQPRQGGAFDLPLKLDQLLTQERVFSDQIPRSSGTIARETANEAVARRRGPGDEAGLEQLAGGSDDPLDALREMDTPGRLPSWRMGRSCKPTTQDAGGWSRHSSSERECAQVETGRQIAELAQGAYCRRLVARWAK